MMPIDPSIAMGVRPLDVPNQLAQYGQLAQIQAAQRQNEIGQMQMDELRRDREGMQKFQADLVAKGGNPDLNEYATMLLQSGNAAHQKMGIELKQKLVQQAQFEKIMGTGTPAPAPANALAPAAAPTNALAAPPNVALLRQKRDSLLAMGTPQAIAAARALDADIALASKEPVYHNVPGVGLVDPRTRQTIMPAVESKPNEQKLYELAVSQGFKGSFRDFHLQNIREARPPAQPRPEQPPVAVVDQATGKIVYVSREEALANRMTPATSIEGIAPKEIQKREAAYPQVTAAFKSAIAENEQLASDLEKLKVHPGLSGMTGTIYGRTLSMRGPSKEAKALYDKIVARGGFQKLTDMRQSSPTGAALGPVSDSEGKYLRAAFGALDPNQNTDSFQKAIDQAITELRSSNGRLQDAYGMTYDYRGEQSAPAPKPGGSALSPAEQSELDALRIRFKK